MDETPDCLLQRALDGYERCPGDVCPFWTEQRCRLGDLRADIDTNPELARLFLDLRARLMGGDSWRMFRRVGPGDRNSAQREES
jgi:hypothetical protein